jgi:dipeptidyl aminopeptidase/acylaminoacyl peptidase
MKRPVVAAALALTATVVLAGSAPTSAPPAETDLPIDYFTLSNVVGDVKIAPSGDAVAWMTGRDAHSMIAVFDLRKKKVIGGVKCPKTGERFEIYDFEWASPSRIVFELAERFPGLAAPILTGEIMAMDPDGRRQDLLYGYRAGESDIGTNLKVRESSYATPELIRTFRPADKTILIAEYPWRHRADGYYFDPDAKPTVYRLNLFSGRKERVDTAPLGGAIVLVDRDDQVRFAVGTNQKQKLAVSWKPSPTADWTVFDLPGFREESVRPRVFGPDNQSVLFTGAREGETYTALYRMDLKSRDVTRVFAFDHASIGRLIFDFSGTKIIGVVGAQSDPSYHWLDNDDRAAKIYQALLRAFPKQQVEVTSNSSDGRFAVVFVSSDVNPGDFYLFDTRKMNAAYLKGVRPWVDPARMRPKTPFTMKARDGVELHGYITTPAGEAPFPLVVMPHGGPYGAHDTWSYDGEVQLLASRGYAVLQVDFRGSGGYGIDFEEAGYRQWGAKIQDDITDATIWAIEQKIAAPDRIAIFGASFGGYAALMGAVREPKLYRCAIGYAGVYDLELVLTSGDIPRSKSGGAYLEKVLGTDHEELKARSPVYNAQRIEVPVLLIHGKEDWRADFAQAKRMKAALKAAGKPFEWVALSHEGHGIFEEETRRDVYERVLQFLARNLAPVATASTQ